MPPTLEPRNWGRGVTERGRAAERKIAHDWYQPHGLHPFAFNVFFGGRGVMASVCTGSLVYAPVGLP